MGLFESNSAWDQSAGSLQVFKLYGGWAQNDSSMSQLRLAIQAIRQRGLALAVEVGPLVQTDECGFQIEGFAGEEGIITLQRIKSAGGELNFVAFDEPYYYGHYYDGPQACRWTAEKIAKDMDSFIQRAREIFPTAIFGDIEPLTGPADDIAYRAWLETFRAVNGYDLAFLHLDIDWADTSWPEQVKSVEVYGLEQNVPVGLIYTGNSQDQTDEAWLAIAGERVKRYELESGGIPAHVIFQSWHDRPDNALPEDDPFTFTGFIKSYFEDKSALGFQEGTSGNLALKKEVSVSRQMTGSEGVYAVDGDPGTVWNAGNDAPQWIEIDLGANFNIQEIRLVISQYPDGVTSHRILVKGSGTGGENTPIHTFESETAESDILTFTPAEPLLGIQFVRIETAASPSWVAWREIEVIQAGEE